MVHGTRWNTISRVLPVDVLCQGLVFCFCFSSPPVWAEGNIIDTYIIVYTDLVMFGQLRKYYALFQLFITQLKF